MEFPDRPTEGDIVEDTETTGRKWMYDGVKWVLVGVPLSDVEFDAIEPIEEHVTKEQDGKVGKVTYLFNMDTLPKINPN